MVVNKVHQTNGLIIIMINHMTVLEAPTKESFSTNLYRSHSNDKLVENELASTIGTYEYRLSWNHVTFAVLRSLGTKDATFQSSLDTAMVVVVV